MVSLSVANGGTEDRLTRGQLVHQAWGEKRFRLLVVRGSSFLATSLCGTLPYVQRGHPGH